jgi:hypothetical protein
MELILGDRLLRTLLIASAGTAIAAGAIFRKHFDVSNGHSHAIASLLKASYILSLGK